MGPSTDSSERQVLHGSVRKTPLPLTAVWACTSSRPMRVAQAGKAIAVQCISVWDAAQLTHRSCFDGKPLPVR